MGDANIQVFKSHSLFLKFYATLRKQTNQNRVAIFYNRIHLLEVNMAKKEAQNRQNLHKEAEYNYQSLKFQRWWKITLCKYAVDKQRIEDGSNFCITQLLDCSNNSLITLAS